MRHSTLLIYMLVLIFSMVSMADIKEFQKDEIEESFEDLSLALENFASTLSAQTKIEPVDYDELKKILPSKVRGFKQSDSHGERKSMFGFRISMADAEFEGKNDSRIDISIIDFGSVKGIAGKALLAWMSAEIDNESDDGYEKTTEYKGYKAFEKFSFKDESGKLSIIVEERFLVNVDGKNTDMKSIKRAMSSVNLKKLKKLRDFGIPKEV